MLLSSFLTLALGVGMNRLESPESPNLLLSRKETSQSQLSVSGRKTATSTLYLVSFNCVWLWYVHWKAVPSTATQVTRLNCNQQDEVTSGDLNLWMASSILSSSRKQTDKPPVVQPSWYVELQQPGGTAQRVSPALLSVLQGRGGDHQHHQSHQISSQVPWDSWSLL